MPKKHNTRPHGLHVGKQTVINNPVKENRTPTMALNALNKIIFDFILYTD
jgi:hypothetical protein